MQDIYNLQKNFFDNVFCFVNNNKISHAYLIETRNLSEIKNIINTFVRIIYSSCEKFDKDNLIDFDQINLDGNYIEINVDGTQIKKEQVIKIQEKFMTKSLNNKYRIYVIYNAEMLNEKAANSLLKFIEEPEDNIIGILVSNNRYSVLETIRSRCQILSLVNNSIDIDLENIDFITEFVSLLENKKLKTISYIPSLCKNEYYTKDKWTSIFSCIRLIYEQALRKKYNFTVNPAVEKILEMINLNNNDVNIIKKIDVLSKTIKKLEYNLNINLMLDQFVIDFSGGDINA